VRDKDFIEMLTRLNSFMKEEAARSGATYIDAQQSTFVASDFEVEGHFLPTGSQLLQTILRQWLARIACD